MYSIRLPRTLTARAVAAALAVAMIGFALSSVTAQAAPPAAHAAKVSTKVLKAGETIFKSKCGSCHTLANAKTKGQVGPNLDKLKPSDKLVVKQVTNGGGVMPAFGKKHLLNKTQIKNVAAYVSSVAGKKK